MSSFFSQLGLSLPAKETHSRKRSDRPSKERPRLVLILDHRAWLEFLSDEWWPATVPKDGVRLGVGMGISYTTTDGRIPVAVSIDPYRLPAVEVSIYQTGQWKHASVRQVDTEDKEIVWPGPIPLSAVEAFTVDEEVNRARLVAMVKGFTNVQIPEQPIKVATISVHAPAPGPSDSVGVFQPPQNWNASRGAAAMAAWAVPAIDPWLDSLCAMLSIENDCLSTAAKKVSWWMAAPWRTPLRSLPRPPLWSAITEVFSSINLRGGWRPSDVLTAVVSRAIELGADPSVMNLFVDKTYAILEDRRTIAQSGLGGDVLELALQLVLLRPAPDRFVAWKDDLPSLPPLAWWTGAILSGFLSGFRDLDLRFRGTAAARRLLAIRTWQLSNDSDTSAKPWPDESSTTLHWSLNGEKIQLLADKVVWAERTGSSRGRWYRADYLDKKIYDAALEISLSLFPEGIRHALRLDDQQVPFTGSGHIAIDAATGRLSVEGRIDLLFGSKVSLVPVLCIDAFRDWVVEGCIAERLPEPPRQPNEPRDAYHLATPSYQSGAPLLDSPPGLKIVQNFISVEEEKEILAEIESAPWRSDLSRRVQHYGWRYDYKARRISSDAYLGLLPEWAIPLAARLHEQELLSEFPDQMIVNEYIRDQGIAKHVDSPESFRGEIATLSLCESWGMVFRGPKGAKIEMILDRRSVAVLSGPARHTWTHEIPKRKNELAGPRHRRVSLTFRKADLQ